MALTLRAIFYGGIMEKTGSNARQRENAYKRPALLRRKPAASSREGAIPNVKEFANLFSQKQVAAPPKLNIAAVAVPRAA